MFPKLGVVGVCRNQTISMRIGIDAKPLTTPFSCGVKSYAENLLTNLAKIDKKNEYIIFATKKIKIPIQRNFKLVKMPNFLPVFRRQFSIPYFVNREKVDIFHNLEPFGSIFLNSTKIVTTVHDVNLDATYPLLSRYFLSRLYCEFSRKGIFRKSSTFITNTETIKEELVNILKKNTNSQIETIYIGYDRNYFRLKSYKTRKGILCMGDFAARKNTSSVIEAYSSLPSQVKNAHSLRIVASTKAAGINFLNIVKKYNVEKFTKVFVAVSNSQLAKLYNDSLLFVHPSLYEGFGIPILEAMACGCPVITSNYGAMREISGDSALLVNPRSKKSIADGILRICEDKKFRLDLSKKGLQRVKEFNWLHTAEKTLKLYERLFLKK